MSDTDAPPWRALSCMARLRQMYTCAPKSRPLTMPVVNAPSGRSLFITVSASRKTWWMSRPTRASLGGRVRCTTCTLPDDGLMPPVCRASVIASGEAQFSAVSFIGPLLSVSVPGQLDDGDSNPAHDGDERPQNRGLAVQAGHDAPHLSHEFHDTSPISRFSWIKKQLTIFELKMQAEKYIK